MGRKHRRESRWGDRCLSQRRMRCKKSSMKSLKRREDRKKKFSGRKNVNFLEGGDGPNKRGRCKGAQKSGKQ